MLVVVYMDCNLWYCIWEIDLCFVGCILLSVLYVVVVVVVEVVVVVVVNIVFVGYCRIVGI